MSELLLPAAYLGCVATRCAVPNNQLSAAAGTFIQARSAHWSRDVMVDPVFVYPNFSINGLNSEVVPAGAGTAKMALEDADGNFFLAEECKSGFAPFVVGLNFFTVKGVFPANKLYLPRIAVLNDNGVPYRQFQNNYTKHPLERFESGTSGFTDKVTGGTIATASSFSYGPCAILSMTRKPSVLIGGDSRQVGAHEIVSDITADIGEVARIIGPLFGYSQMSMSGTLLAHYNSGSHTYRDQLAAYFSKIVNAWGINDIPSDTDVILAGRRTTFANFYPGKVIGTTLAPYTASSDHFNSKSGQKPFLAGANSIKVQTFNELVRQGITGEVGCLEIADGIDPYREGVWPEARNPNTDKEYTDCQFTGYIVGTTLTVTAIASGNLSGSTLWNGIPIVGGSSGAQYGTRIMEQLTGTAGSTGTYRVNINKNVASSGAPITMFVGGFGSDDGLHMSTAMAEICRDSRKANIAVLYR